MSPEILGHQDYTEKADVYSFAIMLWALVVGKEPYSDFKNSWDIARFVTAGKRLDVPKNAGALMIHLITACWAHNPDERPSFDEIVQELQSYVNVKKYGGDEASGDAVTEGDASSYGFGSRANESRGVSKSTHPFLFLIFLLLLILILLLTF
jgi:serine/threonine protein kinase